MHPLSSGERFAQFAATDDVRADLKSKSVRAALSTAVGSAGDFVIRIVAVSILARLLAPGQFGLIAMVTAVTAILGEFSQLGLAAATIQRREITHQQVTNLFWLNAAFGALLTLTIAGLAPTIAGFYQEPRLVPVTMAFATTFLFSGLSVQHEALLIRQMRQSSIVAIRLTATVISVVLAISLALAGYGYWALVWQELSRVSLIAVGVWFACRWIPGLPTRNAGMHGLLRFGGHLTLSQLLTQLVFNFDRLMIGRLFHADILGLYRQAQQLVMAPIEQLNAPISSVSQPGLSVLQDDPARYRRYYQKLVLLVAFASMPLSVFVGIYANEITLVLLGDQWAAASVYIRIFALTAFMRPVLGTSTTVLITCGHSNRLLVFAAARNVILVVLILVGVQWGAEGIAMAQPLSTVVLAIPALAYNFAGTPVTVGAFFRALRTPFIASAAMGAGLLIFRDAMGPLSSIASLISGCGVGAALCAMICFVVPDGRRELYSVFTAVRSSSRRIPDSRQSSAA